MKLFKQISKKVYVFIFILIFIFSLGLAMSSIEMTPDESLNTQDENHTGSSVVEAVISSSKIKTDTSDPDIKLSSVGTTPGKPVSIRIPAINVGSNVEYVGLTPDGLMDSPSGPDNVGWYNLGPRPGELGSSVIDGHSGWKGGIPAVFDNLYKVKIGDKIYVLDDKGETTIFVVRDIQTYDPEMNASSVFFSSDGKSHLNLVTCTGFWNKISKSRSSRLVVFSDRELK